MVRFVAIFAVAAALSACDAVSTVTDGFNQAKTVEAEVESAIGVRPQVGFNWQNGQLRQVTVSFPGLYEGKPLRELAGVVRAAVGKGFKQTPDTIVIGFSLGRPGATP